MPNDQNAEQMDALLAVASVIERLMKVQAENLDLIYLRRWAAELRLTDLLERALADSGLA